jgi:hypothetical protein
MQNRPSWAVFYLVEMAGYFDNPLGFDQQALLAQDAAGSPE